MTTEPQRETPAHTASNGEWPKPAPLSDELLPVKPFDELLLPPSLRPIVNDVSERMQTPPDYAAATAVVSLAGCVNRRASIQPKQRDCSWIKVLNLWGGIVGPPGFMKSPLQRAVTSPLTEIEEAFNVEFAGEFAGYEERKQRVDWERSALREEFKKKFKEERKKEGNEGSTGALLLPVPSDPTPPVHRRLIVMDATTEKLHEILRDNPAGVLVLRDELTGLLAEMDQAGRETERTFYLTAWAGDSGFTMDRIGRGSIHVPSVCVSLFGSIQPARLRHYLSDAIAGGPGDDGLFQRLQILVWPDLPRGYKFIDRPPNGKALANAEGVFQRLALELDAQKPCKLRFDKEAQQLFNQWLLKLETRVRTDQSLAPCVVAHLAKYRSLMPSLAALFTLADRAAGTSEIGSNISVGLAYARQAAAFCQYLESHALRAYGCIVAPETKAARDLGRHLQSGDLGESFTTRDVYLRGWNGLGTPVLARTALEILEGASWVCAIKLKPSGRGRPAEAWNVNPEVLHAG